MKSSCSIFVSLLLLTGCFVARPKYSPPTDLQSNNLKGSVEMVTSRFLDINDEDPDDPARDTRFDKMIVSRYNRQGNIIEEETYAEGGERLSQKDFYIFDETGTRVVSSEYQDLLRNHTTWILYNYDEKGRLAEYSAIGGDWTTVMEYDKRGYPVTVVNYVCDTVNNKSHYMYDRRGRLVEESGITYSYKGKVMREATREYYRELYDKNGDLEKTVNVVRNLTMDGGEYLSEGIIEAKYVYDDRGNWIRRDLYLDGVLFGVWLKEIKYFDE